LTIRADFPQSFISINKTATSDTMFKLVTSDLWFRNINIHVTTHNAYYGDRSSQDADITAGDILSWEDVNLNDVFFKNASAGDNTVITAVGVLMTPRHKKELGVE